jgi:hypothetical protein
MSDIDEKIKEFCELQDKFEVLSENGLIGIGSGPIQLTEQKFRELFFKKNYVKNMVITQTDGRIFILLTYKNNSFITILKESESNNEM